MIPDQSRAARRLLGWARERLAVFSGVSVAFIGRFENEGDATPEARAAIRAALEAAGVEFISENGRGPGVRMREPGDDRSN